jgi:hypothetical protein
MGDKRRRLLSFIEARMMLEAYLILPAIMPSGNVSFAPFVILVDVARKVIRIPVHLTGRSFADRRTKLHLAIVVSDLVARMRRVPDPFDALDEVSEEHSYSL